MPLLFSYGTLQDTGVQLATFGRFLPGRHDALPGYEPSLIPIEDAGLARAAGRTHHDNIRFSGSDDSRVPGTVYEVTEAELAAADRYEEPAGYVRIVATTVAGQQVWVYVHTSSIPQSVRGRM